MLTKIYNRIKGLFKKERFLKTKEKKIFVNNKNWSYKITNFCITPNSAYIAYVMTDDKVWLNVDDEVELEVEGELSFKAKCKVVNWKLAVHVDDVIRAELFLETL